MNLPPVLYLDALSALRRHAERWDDLWMRSGVSQPTARAALIAQWVYCFHKSESVRAIVLTDGDRFVAGLPLVKRRKSRVISTLDIPGNEWSPAGQLMLDSNADRDQLADRLLAAMGHNTESIYWFASIPFQDPSWTALAAAARRSGWMTDVRHHCDVPYLSVACDWETLRRSWSKNFRSQLRRATERLRESGELEFECRRPTDSKQAEMLLDQCLGLEHAGWKGAAGTSVASCAPATRLLKSQAARLASWQQAQWALLKHNGRCVAFEYGWFCKSVYHSFKVGYAADYARFSPGQVLTMRLLQRLCNDPECRTVDFIGPLTPSLARWRPNVYTKGRLVVAYPNWTGRSTVFTASRIMPRIRALRRR